MGARDLGLINASAIASADLSQLKKGFNVASLSLVPWFQALFLMVVSHSFLALFAKQDSRKVLPTFF